MSSRAFSSSGRRELDLDGGAERGQSVDGERASGVPCVITTWCSTAWQMTADGRTRAVNAANSRSSRPDAGVRFVRSPRTGVTRVGHLRQLRDAGVQDVEGPRVGVHDDDARVGVPHQVRRGESVVAADIEHEPVASLAPPATKAVAMSDLRVRSSLRVVPARAVVDPRGAVLAAVQLGHLLGQALGERERRVAGEVRVAGRPRSAYFDSLGAFFSTGRVVAWSSRSDRLRRRRLGSSWRAASDRRPRWRAELPRRRRRSRARPSRRPAG